MIRQDAKRIASNRRAELDHRKKQFATAKFQEHTYPHRLNFYILPPTADITLEQFEQWAIDRLRGLSPPIPPVPNSRHGEKRVLTPPSPRRVRSMFLPQQNPRRDSRAHEATDG